eukprot:g68905.t1
MTKNKTLCTNSSGPSRYDPGNSTIDRPPMPRFCGKYNSLQFLQLFPKAETFLFTETPTSGLLRPAAVRWPRCSSLLRGAAGCVRRLFPARRGDRAGERTTYTTAHTGQQLTTADHTTHTGR